MYVIHTVTPHAHRSRRVYSLCLPHCVRTIKLHMRNYARVIEWESQNGRIEWKNRMEVTRMEEQTGIRMEMIKMVDCNGWPFWASVVLPCSSSS